jgi:hypothetical protein
MLPERSGMYVAQNSHFARRVNSADLASSKAAIALSRLTLDIVLKIHPKFLHLQDSQEGFGTERVPRKTGFPL